MNDNEYSHFVYRLIFVCSQTSCSCQFVWMCCSDSISGSFRLLMIAFMYYLRWTFCELIEKKNSLDFMPTKHATTEILLIYFVGFQNVVICCNLGFVCQDITTVVNLFQYLFFLSFLFLLRWGRAILSSKFGYTVNLLEFGCFFFSFFFCFDWFYLCSPLSMCVTIYGLVCIFNLSSLLSIDSFLYLSMMRRII